ncbi:uncharacterized protein LOC135498163 isoform X2 [Lineus longissimus]|uniref:uncharacterized protein LOC135498163 isoform X2 n=1 Tax=Lineus longissimus TaxID=88925 RepID=UPI002B4F443B
METMIIEASAVQTSGLPVELHQEPIIYEKDPSPEHGSSPNSQPNVVCETSFSPKDGVPNQSDSLQNMVCVPKDGPENAAARRVQTSLNSQSSQSNLNADFQNTLCNIKSELVPSISPANVIHEFKPQVIHDQGQHLHVPSGLHPSETLQAIHSITSQFEESENEEAPSYCDMKPLGGENLPTMLTEYSVGRVDGEVFDVKQAILAELTPQAETVDVDLSRDILNDPGDSKDSEVALAHTGHIYADLKPMVLEYHAPSVEIEPDSEIRSHSHMNVGFQFDTKVEEQFSGSDSGSTLTGSPDVPVSRGSIDVPVNQNDAVAPRSTSSNESMVAMPACNLSKPHHVHFATNQVQENHDSGTNASESGGLVQQFRDITGHNQQPETIMLGPAEMLATILDLNSHEVEERVIKHNKSLKLKKFKKKSVEMNLACEWEECEEVSNDLNQFINHITAHIGSNLEDYAEEPDLMACNWRHCGYETQRGIRDILRHVYFHAFHVKLKCLGIQMIIDNNLHACRTDGSSRNLIPELPESLICGWVHCGHVCENAEYFYRHVDMHADSAPLDNFKCFWEGCTVKVRNRTRLRDHLRSHTQEKVIACPTCGGLFSNRCKFSDHLRRQGPMDTLCFQCSHCNKKYTTERLLRDHMRVHVNHYKCPFCDMTCPNPSTLNAHIKYRHSDEKPYECERCQHKTKSAGDLRRHMEVHNEKKMFKCEFPGCDYSHKTFHGVSYHYRLLHQTPKKYLCHMCPATFERGSNLTKHLKRTHRFRWPSGHSRFRYRQQEDGTMGLQMVRYESVELATHILDKDGEHVHAAPREGHSAGFNSVPAYQSDATETPIVNDSDKPSNADADKSADTPADVFLTEADLSYNLEMLGDVALHEPEFSCSAENSPVKAKRKAKRVGNGPAKSARMSDLPSPIHGSAFQPNVAVHHEAASKIITLSSNLSTSPEKSYELTSAQNDNNKTPEKEPASGELHPESDSQRHTNSRPWKVTFNNSPRKRGRSAGRSQAANKQSVEGTPACQAKQKSARSPRLKRAKRLS